MIARLMGFDTIAPIYLHQLIGQRQVTVIDVNALASWAEAHVPGAVHLDSTGDAAEQLPQDKDASLVFYCSGPMCSKAPRAARRAEKMGYRNVKVMSAGISGWRSGKLPTECG